MLSLSLNLAQSQPRQTKVETDIQQLGLILTVAVVNQDQSDLQRTFGCLRLASAVRVALVKQPFSVDFRQLKRFG